MLEWLERRRVPSALAAFICVLVFIAMANIAVASIVLPAADWVRLLPERIGRVRDTLDADDRRLFGPRALHRRHRRAVRNSARPAPRTVRLETPNSLLDIIATSAPFAAIQMFFALLVIFFFLAGWTADAQAHDHHPRKLRRGDDHRAGDPAGGRRDLDLSRHDHDREHRHGPGRRVRSSSCSTCRRR